MIFYIKEWPNKMATLMTENGVVLCTFQRKGKRNQKEKGVKSVY